MAMEIDFAAQAMMNNTYLITCATANPMSLVNALKNLALVGYTLNPVRKQGYLVPMGKAITFMPSYMGLVDELAASGLVKKIEAHPVFEGEQFEVKHGTGGGIFHKPNPWGKREKDNLCGCYWYAVFGRWHRNVRHYQQRRNRENTQTRSVCKIILPVGH